MASILDHAWGFGSGIIAAWHRRGPASFYIITISATLFLLAALIFGLIYLAAPVPRDPIASELFFSTVEADGKESQKNKLPCWLDQGQATKKGTNSGDKQALKELSAGPAEVLLSLVIPAYNEEHRLRDMLDEAVDYLNTAYPVNESKAGTNKGARQRKNAPMKTSEPVGWEILIISDGSTDKTEATALEFARSHSAGGSIRVVRLAKNRGKGGAVVHGMRHVRGQYIIFADADGASKFSDLQKLVEACDLAKDDRGRAVAIGSRAHLVNSQAVVSRSALRNFLMHCFHLLIWLSTTPATSEIKDTQCGFKLFTRPALPYIVPYMNSEGWIFDVEMLMLAERAAIPVMEVQIGWHEVKGSKLNVVWDSIGMAWTLLVLRAAWGAGIYRTVDEDPGSQKTLSEFLNPNEQYIKYQNPPKMFG